MTFGPQERMRVVCPAHGSESFGHSSFAYIYREASDLWGDI